MGKKLLEAESMRSRGEIADYLRQVADKLDDGGELTLTAGEKEVQVSVPDRAEFEISVEQEPENGGTETSVELEIEWNDAAKNGHDVDIS